MVVKLRRYNYELSSTFWCLVGYLSSLYKEVPSLIGNSLDSPGPAKVSIALRNPFGIVGECQGTAGGWETKKKSRAGKKHPKSKAKY